MNEVKLSDLKLKGLRKTIDIKKGDDIHQIYIFDPLGDRRQELINKLVSIGNNIEDIEDVSTNVFIQIYELLFEECVEGLDLDIDLEEAINNPTYELLDTIRELGEIVFELNLQAQIPDLQSMQQQSLVYTINKSLNLFENIEKIAIATEKQQKELEEIIKGIEENNVRSKEELYKVLETSRVMTLKAADLVVRQSVSLEEVLKETEQLEDNKQE